MIKVKSGKAGSSGDINLSDPLKLANSLILKYPLISTSSSIIMKKTTDGKKVIHLTSIYLYFTYCQHVICVFENNRQKSSYLTPTVELQYFTQLHNSVAGGTNSEILEVWGFVHGTPHAYADIDIAQWVVSCNGE